MKKIMKIGPETNKVAGNFFSVEVNDGVGDQFLFATDNVIFRRVLQPKGDAFHDRLEAEAKKGVNPEDLANVWQTDGNWLGGDGDERGFLRDLIGEAIDEYLTQLYNAKANFLGRVKVAKRIEHEIELWGWAGGSRIECNNPPHVHRNSMLSGIYYIRGLERGQYDDEDLSGCVVFILSAGGEEVVMGSYAAPHHLPVHPVVGTLLIFPSFLRHFVNRYKYSIYERVYIAFNCCVKTPNEVMVDSSRRR